MAVTCSLQFLFAAAVFQLSYSAPVDFLAPQTLPAGCRLEVITVQEEVEETKVEKVVCETEFRPTCTVKLEKDCKNVTRPACEVEEKMECVENTVSQCSFETRVGSTGEENEIEDATTTEKVAQQETNDNDVLENNYDEILDAVNTIFGSGITEDVNGGEAKEIVTSTEA